MSSGSSAKRHLVYRWQDDVENLEAYRSGGYHPIQLGDELSNERYHVVHKLGYGSFSTVWLARDHLENRYVSLKVIKANSSQSSLEAEVEKSLRCGDPHHPGRPFVLSRLDEFYIDGPNGHHRCLVTEVVGPSILDVKEATEHGLLSIDTARKITAQLALGLAYIHSCGIVHGVAFDFAHIGKDIHTHNVASHLPNFDSWTTQQVYANFGEPEKEPISRYDNQPLGPEAPPYAVQPSYFWSIDEEDLAKQIKIIDFGEASFSKDERKALHTPLPFRAPESFFGESIGPPADMWAFGCTVFDIFGNGHLFEGFMPSKDVFLLEIVSCLGKLPPQWWQQWNSRCFFSSSDGTPRTDKYAPVYEQSISLALRIKEMRSSGSDQPQEALGPFKPEELADLENLLTAILKYLPSERMTAEDVSKLKWIREQCLTTGANDSNILCADPLPSQSEIVSEKG